MIRSVVRASAHPAFTPIHSFESSLFFHGYTGKFQGQETIPLTTIPLPIVVIVQINIKFSANLYYLLHIICDIAFAYLKASSGVCQCLVFPRQFHVVFISRFLYSFPPLNSRISLPLCLLCSFSFKIPLVFSDL